MNEIQQYRKDERCEKCGSDILYDDCWSCGGEGGRGWDDLQSEDPLWYSPDDFIECDICNGKGVLGICLNENCNK